MRPSGRAVNELREISFSRDYIKYPEGSVLVHYGQTIVLCNVTIKKGVPPFVKEQNAARNEKQGWLTAEYGMLPRATETRTDREAVRGKQSGRTIEIQRLIGRALRNCVNLKELGEYTITIDCDVLQADGGTRTAAMTGSCVALYDGLQAWQKRFGINRKLFLGFIAAISVGIYEGKAVLDLDYIEDSRAETDMNVIMNDALQFIEIQGTAEKGAFQRVLLDEMLDLAKHGIEQIIQKQKSALNLASID